MVFCSQLAVFSNIPARTPLRKAGIAPDDILLKNILGGGGHDFTAKCPYSQKLRGCTT